MVKLILFLMLLFFPFTSSYSQNQGEAASGAQTSSREGISEQNTWDFGQVTQGEQVKHDFILTNESSRVLEVKDVNTSCGCTVSSVKNKTIPPHNSTTIEVKFNSKGYSGDVKQYAYVYTNSLDKPIIRFIIKAYVVKAAESVSK